MKLHKIYGDHSAYLSQEHADFFQNLDVTSQMFGHRTKKGWSAAGFHTAHETIAFYVQRNTIHEWDFSSEPKYIIILQLDKDKHVVEATLYYDHGRDIDFKTVTMATGIQQCIEAFIEDISH